jgi:hypothetical protein
VIRFDGQYSYLQKKNVIDDIKSGVDGVAKSWESVIGTALPSFFTEGKFGPPRLRNAACQGLC